MTEAEFNGRVCDLMRRFGIGGPERRRNVLM